MAQADGRIVIETSLETGNLVQGAKRIDAACKSAARSAGIIGEKAQIAAAKAVAAYNRQTDAVEQQSRKVDALREKLAQMEKNPVKSEEYVKATNEVERLTEALAATRKERDGLLESGADPDAYPAAGLSARVEMIKKELAQAKALKAELESKGTAYVPQETTPVAGALTAEQGKLDRMNEQLQIAGMSLARVANATSAASAETGRYGTQLDKAAKSQKDVPGKDTGKKMNDFGGALKNGVKSLLKYGLGIRSLFALFRKLRTALSDGIKNLVQYSGSANDSMSAIKSSLTQVKNSLATAFQPILTAVAPILTKLCNMLSQAITYIGMFFTALSGGTKFTKAIGVQEDYAKSLQGTSAAAKEAQQQLSGLDEINTWQENSAGGGGGGVNPSDMFETVEIDSKITGIANKIKEALEPVKTFIYDNFINPTQDWAASLDLSGLKESFAGLGEAALPVLQQISGLLSDIYQGVILPLTGWSITTLLPAIGELLKSVLGFIRSALKPLINGVKSLFEAASPIVDWIKDTVVEIIGDFSDAFDDLAALFEEKGPEIEEIFSGIGEIIAAVWKIVGPILNTAKELVRKVFGFINQYVVAVIGTVIDILRGLVNFIAGVFTGDWSRAWKGLKQIVDGWWQGFKKVLNVIIGGINGLVSGVVKGLNYLIRALNKLSFDIPSWVPGLGGKHFGLNIKEITAPKIPLLATGAVIPPNAPFTAVLGDQRHGNNIETPEALLRQVVREESGGSAVYQFVAQLNRRTIFNEIIDEAKLRQASSGVNPFLLGRV